MLSTCAASACVITGTVSLIIALFAEDGSHKEIRLLLWVILCFLWFVIYLSVQEKK